MLTIERRCRFRIVLSDQEFLAAKIRFFDASGNSLAIHQMLANSVWVKTEHTLLDGKSIELGASEKAAMLVAVAGERELRIPIQLRPGEVTIITK